jgi:hypothetical protein
MGKKREAVGKGRDRDMEGDRGSMGVEDRLRLIWPEDITEDFINVIKTTRRIYNRGFKPQGQVEVSVQSKWLLGLFATSHILTLHSDALLQPFHTNSSIFLYHLRAYIGYIPNILHNFLCSDWAAIRQSLCFFHNSIMNLPLLQLHHL